MSKTVYVEVTNNYSRTVWDSTGATTYAIGDRVEYNDGSRNIIFVCIENNNSTSTPDTNTSGWVEAGSEEYPFLVLDGANNMGGKATSEWHWHGHYSVNATPENNQTENFLVESIGSWAQDNPNGTDDFYARAPGATIVLGDGRYAFTYGTYAMWLPSGANIVAKNKGKAYLITNNYFWGGDNVTLKDLVIYSSDIWSTVPGCYSGIYNMYSCLITQETPWGSLFPTKQVSSENRQARPFSGWKGGTIKNCTFDYSYRGPSYWFTQAPVGLVENNTFYCRVKHNQYNLLGGSNSAIFKNNIFYIKELYDALTNQNLRGNSIATEGENIIYIENNLSASGGSIINNTDFKEINPLFIGADSGNFSLRPSSPLIGGIKSENVLSDKYPDGVWVDHNHNPVQSSYSYTLDSGDGTNYTFSGDATGTDPTLNANIRDTLTFTNSTGGHPLAIYNSQGIQVASESSGTTTFTPKYPDTYYYQCTVSGHENMRGNIVVSRGTLGSYDNPFGGFYDAIDAGYYDNSATLLFKEGDHELYLQNPGNYGSGNTSISSSFSGGLFFIGEDPKTTRFTTGNNLNGFAAFYVNGYSSDATQAQTPLTIESIGFHINNQTSYLNRGLFAGTHWKNFTLKNSKVSCSSTGAINGNLFDYNTAITGHEFNLIGCEMNVPLSNNGGGGASFLSGHTGIKYTVESCTFTKLDGYSYVSGWGGPSPIMVSGAFNGGNGSSIKNCIFYSSVGGNFGKNSIVSGVFSSCIFHSTTNSFITLPPDMDVNSSQDPLFIKTTAGQEDLRLRPDSPLIGGISSPGSTAQTGIFYVDLANGDDANDGTTVSNAFKTLTAAHSASIHLDTIVIVDEYVSLTARLSLPGGRKYKPLTHCTIDGNNIRAVEIYDTADVDTYVSDFNFINLRTSTASSDYGLINLISSNSNSLFVFTGCYIDGIITNGRTSAIGGTNSAGCRAARDGSLVKNCTLNVGWTAGGTAGNTSQGFVAINYADLIGCTFYVKDVTPLGMSSLFIVGQGGVGSWSHGPPLGPVVVKDCIVHGNNRLSYTSGNSGSGTDLGFVSNTGVLTSNANYVVYNTCFYNMTGATPTFNRGAIAGEIGISNPEDTLFFTDPKFINPTQGNFKLRPNSPLVGK